MFIFNIKINGSKIFKIFFSCVIACFIIILGFVMYKVFAGANNEGRNQSCIPKNKVYEIQPQNYTNILKAVHDNIDSYIGKKITFTGYVYRISDLNDNQFILARNMLINSNSQYVVVGFLCECDDAQKFADDTWVKITGTIIKGNYHGDMPIIKINDINKVNKPTTNEYVYPPDDSYIPTSSIL